MIILSRATQPVASNHQPQGAVMFYVSGTASDPVASRPVYDNPPVIVAAPRWTRSGRLASAVVALATIRRRQARATSPAACGVHSR
jgi:hypothetical protein